MAQKKNSRTKSSTRNKKNTKKQSRKDAENVLRDGPIRKRARQPRLPGVEEDKGSKAIDDAAYEYVEARDAMQLSTKLVHQKEEKLIKILKRERPGQKGYRHTVGGETITVNITVKDPTEKAKVKIAAVDEENEFVRMDQDDQAGDVEAMDAEDAGAGVEDASVD